MKRQYINYSKELLEEAIRDSKSYSEALRKLGKRPVGGSITNMKFMCNKWNINTDHMTGQSHNKGNPSKRKLSAGEILVEGKDSDHRQNAQRLKRALDEIGREYKCVECNNPGKWFDEDLVLEIDHINNCYWNNKQDNLQYLCPNCHTIKTKRCTNN